MDASLVSRRTTSVPVGAELILSLNDAHLFALEPVTTWPPAPDLPVLFGPRPDGQEHVWTVTTVGAALKRRPGQWQPAARFTTPTPSAPDGLPAGARVFGRIGSTTTLYTTLPLGLAPSDDDVVYVVGGDQRVVATPYPVLWKFGRWTPVDPAVQARTAPHRPQAIPRRLRG